jgi:Fanconi anemia group M protein
MTKVLFIDHRERSGLEKLVKKYCDRKGLLYQERENLITDYAFASIGIEAKSIQDYMGSLYSGHLERQLQNLDDNYNQFALVIHGTVDHYILQARKGGKKLRYPNVFNTFLGSIARFSNDYDMSIFTFPDKSSAARFISKRFEKHGTLGQSSTYRMMRKTASEDRRIDTLRMMGCSEAIAKRLLEEFGSIVEITGCSPKELQTVDGVGKITASRIIECFNSEEPLTDEKVKMTRA